MANRYPTFGLIVALTDEFVAMKSMLDEVTTVHIKGDSARYTKGSLASAVDNQPHWVVLRLLEEASTDIAATACANLVRSFDSVACVIMVGIAAGVPNSMDPYKHVNLGDIVVASWGLIDYDHVDETATGRVLRWPLPPPSPVLRAAAASLEVKERSGQRPWEQWLDCSRSAAMSAFERPHAAGCAVGVDSTVTRVHHGRIGSGNRSLRNAQVRDALAGQHDLRALEMEGRGIGISAFWQGIGWFMVRGISDYGDEKTDRTWRPYAALVAAAYTRALLAECLPVEPRQVAPGHSPIDLDGLCSTDTKKQIRAAKLIGSTRLACAIPLLVACLEVCMSPQARVWMILALGQIGTEQAEDELRHIEPRWDSDRLAIQDAHHLIKDSRSARRG